MDVSTSHTRDQHDGPPFAAFSFPNTSMDPDHVPAEVWQEIFSLVPRSADILHVMLASKRFYVLALRALHHTVVWRQPEDVKQNIQIWADHPGMHLAVDRLVCSVPAPSPHNTPSRGIDYSSLDECWRSNITSDMCNAAIARMLSFKQLSSVTFTDLHLGYRHFELIYSLPQLRTLRIERCGVQSGRFLNVFDPSTLPITHLTMRNLRRLDREFLTDGTCDNTLALLNLASAPNLHTLVVDPSAEVFKYVFGPGPGDAPALPQAAVWAGGLLLFPPSRPPPPHLQRLFIERKHQPGRTLTQAPAAAAHYGWPLLAGVNMHLWNMHVHAHAHAHGHGHAHAHGGDSFPEAALFAFLRRCPSLTTYGTYHCATQNTQLPVGVLPALRTYAGPVGTLLGVVGNGRPIRALRLTNCTGPEAAGAQEREREQGGNGPGNGAGGAGPGGAGLPNTVTGHREGLPALASVKCVLAELEELELEFAAWDDEIMHAIVGFFPKLCSLKVTYEAGGPSETALVAMGPELLSRLPQLKTLHLYLRPPPPSAGTTHTSGEGYDSEEEVECTLRHPLCLFDDTFDTLEDELRELVIPWNRYCPALREVQLMTGYRLLRGYAGGKWNLQRIGRGEDVL